MNVSIGFANLGNTCYINSCLQCIRKIPELRGVIFKSAAASSSVDALIFKAWSDLLRAIAEIETSHVGQGAHTPTIVVNPATFIKTVYAVAFQKKREVFSGWAQNDISEFLLFLFESIHETIKRPVAIKINGTPSQEVDNLAVQCYRYLQQVYQKEYSELNELFYGVSVTQIKSPTNKTKILSSKPEHYFIINLPIVGGGSTIYDGFDAFCADEILEGDNAWFNDATGKKEPRVAKSTVFWNFPKILIITLNRFRAGHRKNCAHVDFPIENLNLSSYVKGYRASEYVYDLFGISNHHGSGISGGHYTAVSREMGANGRFGRWYEHNDTAVREVENPGNLVTPAAYCLFYRRK